jgi:hypothetical protein
LLGLNIGVLAKADASWVNQGNFIYSCPLE